MAVLSGVLETLPRTDVMLEAFDRSGAPVTTVNGDEFLHAVQAFRRELRGWDVGERKAICLLYRPEETVEFLVAMIAAMAERWTVVPLYPNWSAKIQRMYMETYGLRAIIHGSGFRSRVAKWQSDRGAAPPFERVVEFSETELQRVIENEPRTRLAPQDVPLADLPADHPCAWIFTSGTSGQLAKLTEISLENLDAAVENIRDIDFLQAGMTLHSPLSTSHIFAFVVVLGILSIRPRRVIFSDVQYLARLPQSKIGKVDGVILVPIVINRMRATFYEKLEAALDPRTVPPALQRLARIPRPVRRHLKRMLQRAEDAVIDMESSRRIGLRRRGAILTARRLFGRLFRERLGSPEFVVVGGAKPNLQAMAFMEVMGVRCLQGWGMTETTGPLAVCRLGDRFRGAFGTCGFLFSGAEAQIADGELIVSGPQVARGYHEPNGNFTPFDGKKNTGDYAEFDPSGRLILLGKASDRITTENGLNYNPIPLEEQIQAQDLQAQHLLEEVVVIGDGQPRLGAVFFLREGVEGSNGVDAYVQGALKTLNASLPVDERIAAWAVSPTPFRDSGFLGPSGKLIRRLVEEEYAGIFTRATASAT